MATDSTGGVRLSWFLPPAFVVLGAAVVFLLTGRTFALGGAIIGAVIWSWLLLRLR